MRFGPQALISYGLAFLCPRGYTPIQTPFFMQKVCPPASLGLALKTFRKLTCWVCGISKLTCWVCGRTPWRLSLSSPPSTRSCTR